MKWEDFVEDQFNATETNRILASVNWDAWIYQPGLPPVTQNFATESSNFANLLANEYVQWVPGKSSPKDYQNFTTEFYSNLKVVFLENLVYNEGTTKEIL
jgi:leukotriene-A4 hydrolase